MEPIYVELANKVAATMRADKKDFDTAFAEVMQNYQHYDWKTTRIKIGSILGKRKKRPRKKQSGKQLNLFFGIQLNEMVKDAKECEASLIAGIPENDL